MPKQLFLEGFQITPIVHAIDLDQGSLERKDYGQQFVPAADVDKFFAEHWPNLWEQINANFAEYLADLDKAIAATGPNRAARRKAGAAKKATPTGPADATRGPRRVADLVPMPAKNGKK